METNQISVTFENIAGNITTHPTYMAIDLGGTRYPAAKPEHENVLDKVMTYTPYAMGSLALNAGQIVMADEAAHPFLTLATSAIKKVQLGIYQTMVRSWGMVVPFENQLTLNLVITTEHDTYDLLNTDLNVLPVLVAWLQEQAITIEDPMKLQAIMSTTDWANVKWADIEKLAQGTAYEIPNQMIGAAAPTQKNQ
ncbi:hypothetical protein [Lactiplantibacillus fabifermentans]|uniref:Uncharacterized protein n=2 Tax=Lactiplantibacillus fabifermentans TaxID=483011 RepID=A0A0R2NGV2_9LACO|nr:hypothetical protein [Lactiplantibacillus fabifermentans]ETY75406.1 hypothetical protein LFAB_02100 [Lactiplantibacillus fabifermentans T30PCM01]KRO25054.1 hypothetical protein DY78_GL001409 [Lactiplantibacillus fabifermentans DSM 21115]